MSDLFDLIDEHQEMRRHIWQLEDAVREAADAAAAKVREIQDAAESHVIAMLDEAGDGGLLNREVKDRLLELAGDEYGPLLSNVPYDLAGRGIVSGEKEPRPTRAGKMMKQRVWYLVEEADSG